MAITGAMLMALALRSWPFGNDPLRRFIFIGVLALMYFICAFRYYLAVKRLPTMDSPKRRGLAKWITGTYIFGYICLFFDLSVFDTPWLEDLPDKRGKEQEL